MLKTKKSLILFTLLFAVISTVVVGYSNAAPIYDGGYQRSETKIKRARAGSPTRIALIAQQQLNYTEQPVNKVKFFQWAGDRPGAPGPWCSVFATWVWHAAGVRLDGNGDPYPMEPGVRQVRDRGIQNGRFHRTSPKVGDAIIYGPNGSDHIGIVIKVSGKKLTVIEGNSGLDGQPDKYVIKRTIKNYRSKNVPHGKVYGFVSPPKRTDIK